MRLNPNQYWIVKPASSSQGKGIYITNSYREIRENLTEGNIIVSHYIQNPLLINNLKFDLRIYVAVTSVDPLRVYVYEDGLARFATTDYHPPESQQGLNNREGKWCHLTNYSLNKFNKKGFVQNTDADDDTSGSKWSIKGLREMLAKNGIDDTHLFKKIYEIINKTILSAEPTLASASK